MGFSIHGLGSMKSNYLGRMNDHLSVAVIVLRKSNNFLKQQNPGDKLLSSVRAFKVNRKSQCKLRSQGDKTC